MQPSQSSPHLRLTALMIEVEQPEGLSSRKLVLETAKHNVLTAYDGPTGLEMMRRFPNIDVVIMHRKLQGMPFEELVRAIKEIRKDVRIIALSPNREAQIDDVDYVLSSHDPQALLQLLAKEFGADKSIR